MLNEFKNYLLNKNYEPSTAEDYQGRIERLCKKEQFSLEHLSQNIKEILPLYEVAGKKASYGKRSHTSVRQALRRFNLFLMEGAN